MNTRHSARNVRLGLAAVGLALLLAGWLASCRNGRSHDGKDGQDEKLRVAVSVLPQAYFVNRIGGDHVAVDVVVGPGQEPHTFEPTPRQMANLSRASLYLRIGVPFEDTLCRKLAAGHEHMRIVDIRKGIDLHPMAPDHGHEEHAHHDHAEGEMDPHVWMSPRLAEVLSQNICDALCQADPAHQTEYQANLRKLQTDLDRLDRQIAEILAPLKGRTFYVFHPAFGYFAAAYGLKQEAVETEGKAPLPRHTAQLIQKARADGVKVIFVQPEFSTRAAETIAAEIHGAVVPIDPLAYDYIENLTHVAQKIKEGLSAHR